MQRAARSALARSTRTYPEARLRGKLERWQLPLFPRLRAQRAAQIVPRLRRLVPPRVVAAVLRTWFNGWCTRRRFQQNGRCIFGCKLGADALEHYICCSRIHQHGVVRLRLPPAGAFEARGVSFLLLDPQPRDDALTLRALLLAAAYQLHCSNRRGQPLTDGEECRRALQHALREAARGHAQATQTLDAVWVR